MFIDHNIYDIYNKFYSGPKHNNIISLGKLNFGTQFCKPLELYTMEIGFNHISGLVALRPRFLVGF